MATRALAVVIVAVVLVYHVLRVTASRCTGGACDWYIPFSLFLPLIAILLAVLTAGFGAYAARARRGWSALLGMSGILASIGTILAAMIFSDNDTKVWVATVLVLTVPLAVFASAAWRPTTIT
jgi:hypothetical protein